MWQRKQWPQGSRVPFYHAAVKILPFHRHPALAGVSYLPGQKKMQDFSQQRVQNIQTTLLPCHRARFLKKKPQEFAARLPRSPYRRGLN
jgi:hypothetical protein